jgi:hypothetical protein
MQKQFTKYRTISLYDIITRKVFQTGFNDARNNKPFKYDHYTTSNEEFYARGRQFAILYDGPLYENGRISVSANQAMLKLAREKLIL